MHFYEDVLEIRRLSAENLNNPQIAKLFNVHASYVCRLVNKERRIA